MAKKAQEQKPKQQKRNKKQKKKLTPEEISRIMWMNARESYRHQVERNRPSWITSDDMIDSTNYFDPDENYNPFKGW